MPQLPMAAPCLSLLLLFFSSKYKSQSIIDNKKICTKDLASYPSLCRNPNIALQKEILNYTISV